MKSIKGGREPSIIKALASFSIAVIAIVALGLSKTPGSPAYVGVGERGVVLLAVLILIAICFGIYELYSVFSKDEPSEADATDEKEETDPQGTGEE